MAKRGRKNSEEKNKVYFGVEQEKAVIDYLNEDTREGKEEIFETKLRKPFEKMIESIIRRYSLYIQDENSGDTFNDVQSFLMTKMDKFKPEKNTKAYSFYGTICKNHLIQRIENYSKELERNPRYDDISSTITNNSKYVNSPEYGNDIASEAIEHTIDKIQDMIDNPQKYSLKENEVRMGAALKNVLENWDYVLTTDGSNKLNKNTILLFLRETTGFDTKGVRDNMKKFKKVFWEIKKSLIE